MNRRSLSSISRGWHTRDRWSRYGGIRSLASFVEFAEYIFRIDELIFGNSPEDDSGEDEESIADEPPPPPPPPPPAQVVPQQRFKDCQSVLGHYSDGEFLTRFRLTKATVTKVLQCLSWKEKASGRDRPLSPTIQLLVTLRFYGGGTFDVANGDPVNVSHATTCRVIVRVTELIAKELFPRTVRLPGIQAGSEKVVRDFHAIAGFPKATGCVGCTQVEIKAPRSRSAEAFRNSEGYYAVKVQAIVGPKHQFFDLVASWAGSTPNSRIFDESRVRSRYEKGEVPGVLLGDASYPCTSFLMTPLVNPVPDSPQGRYQAAHAKTHQCVERAFELWKRRFPCLDRRPQQKAEQAVIAMVACAALHNMACLFKDPCPPALPCPGLPSVSHQRTAPQTPSQADTAQGVRNRALLIARCFS